MNDSNDIEKNKPTVFYAQKKTDEKRRSDKKTTGRNDRPYAERKDKKSQSSANKSPYKTKNTDTKNSSSSSRIETFKPTNKKPEQRYSTTKDSYNKENNNRQNHSDFYHDDSGSPVSPWKQRVKKQEQLPTFSSETESKDSVDDSILRKQRQEEVIVYSENACKAVFSQRPDAIVKTFLTEDMTTKFRDLVLWLAKNHRGYDVISDEQMTRIAGTPHHGGVSLIVKKRTAILATDYIKQNQSQLSDCVLAIDDINNPHNLGGLIRSAAFFQVNGVVLRNINVLESGAALRVAEGGAEYVTPIKADDFVVTIEQFKSQGYQIHALLPCKIKAIKSTAVYQTSFNSKSLFILFQQVNKTLLQCADSIVHLPGSDAMSSLNISVATGILLSAYQQNVINIYP